MSDLRRTLTNLAERGTPIGSERLRDRVLLGLASGSSAPSWGRVDARRPTVVALTALAMTLLLFGTVPLLFGWLGRDGLVTTTATSVTAPQPLLATSVAPSTVPPVVGVGDGQAVSVTVSGVSGHAGDELAGVLYEGGELTDLDRDALGGFWSVVSSDDFTTTEVVREPGIAGVGRFPFVADEALTVAPGRYTLVLWVDLGLGGMSRWVPINTDGMGLFGCQVVFEVGDDAQTDVVVSANLEPDGWNTNCTTP